MPEPFENRVIPPHEKHREKRTGYDDAVDFDGNDYQISPEILEAGETQRKNDEEQANRLIEKIKTSSDTTGFPEVSVTETQSEKREVDLSSLTDALDELVAIGRERSSNHKSTLRASLKGALKAPGEWVQEKRALSAMEKALPELERAIRGNKEDRKAAWEAVERMTDDFYGDESIHTYFAENERIAEKLMDWSVETVFRNEEAFVSETERSDPASETAPIKVFSSIVSKKYSRYTQRFDRYSPQTTDKITALGMRILPTLQRNIDTLKGNDREEDKELLDQHAVALYPMLLQDEEVAGQSAAYSFSQAWVGGSGGEKAKGILSDMLFLAEGRREVAYSRIVAEFGIDPKKFIDASKVTQDKQKHQTEDLVAVRDLEAAFPGAPKRLAEDYGILSFSRYPQGALLKQLEREDDSETPYGIILNPREDWNGGFYDDKAVFSELADSVEDEKMNMRIFECESKTDAAKKLIRLNRKYGAEQKIRFAVVGGHGNKELLELGQTERSTVRQKDIEGKAMQELRDYFDENATIVLNSCSTGDDFGLGESLSRLARIKVIAPDRPTSLLSLRMMNGGALVAEYKKGSDNKDSPLRSYSSGTLEVGTRSKKAQEILELFESGEK